MRVTLFFRIVLTLSIVVYTESHVFAMSKLECLGAGLAEMVLPGSGYAYTRQWDKAALLGGSRWIVGAKAYQARESDYYQEEIDDVFKQIEADDSASGKTEIQFHYNKETWQANYYSSLSGNLLLTTWGDLYQHGCEKNTETYTNYMLAPFRFDHFYDNWKFWIPTLYIAAAYTTIPDTTKTDYYLGRGLTKSDLKNDSFYQYYMVGLGEEMFFRGVVQDYFYHLLIDKFGFSKATSRHLSVFSGAAVFGAAHDGNSLSASPGIAFLMGVYLGYVYMPSIDEFDLTTAIAIHSWWDLILTYAYLNSAEFHEQEEEIQLPLMNIAFTF